MRRLMPTSLRMLDELGSAIRASREARRWTQARLGAAVRLSGSQVGRIERGEVADVALRLASEILEATGGRLDVRFVTALTPAGKVRDRAHARCVAYVMRRLERAGFEVVTEVASVEKHSYGFIDVLAYHPVEHWVIVIEVKTEIRDVGGVDRQVSVGERGAWAASHQRGWRPRAVNAWLLVLATEENDRRLAEHRAYIDRAFTLRHRVLQAAVDGAGPVPERGLRGIAMIDPASRRRAWLLPTWLDGSHRSRRYRDRPEYLLQNTRRPMLRREVSSR